VSVPAVARDDAVIIGLGAADRGDDAAGLEAVRLLARRPPAGTRVVALPGRAAALLDLWRDTSLAIVIDAAVSGAAPGTVHRVDARLTPLPPAVHHRSTHDLGLADVVELARALGRLPPRLVVLGIEVVDLSPGAGLSPAVRPAVRRAAHCALLEVRSMHAGRKVAL
jgi:hydrogenase maturation protease